MGKRTASTAVCGAALAFGLLGVGGVGGISSAAPPGCNQIGNGEISQPGTTQQQRNNSTGSQGEWTCTWNSYPTG